jgi:hypothetical protein
MNFNFLNISNLYNGVTIKDSSFYNESNNGFQQNKRAKYKENL